MWLARAVGVGTVVCAAIAASCIQWTPETCGDGTACPQATACAELPAFSITTCVSDAQVDACDGADEGTACLLGPDPGTCFSGACFRATCGDGIRDLTEACDDGNRTPGDGCSATCGSLERCGDGLVDPALGEQCDDGRAGLSGDGCSSTCVTEYDVWRGVAPKPYTERVDIAAASAPGGGVLVFGGTSGSGGGTAVADLDETWLWSSASWSPIAPPTTAPSRRSFHTMAFDPIRQRVVLFGGRDNGGNVRDDLWEWDGIAWTERVVVSARPSARSHASLACGAGRCVLFGGVGPSGLLADTWSWDGTGWTQLAGPGPSARRRAALVFDSTRSVFVLFGGYSDGPRQDTWELTTQWTQIPTFTLPTASTFPSAAFDKLTGAVVLVTAATTWTYSNGNWLNMNRSISQSSTLASDSLRGDRVIAITVFGDVLEWGSSWNQYVERAPEAPANAMLAAYLPTRGRTLVVEPSGSWEWTGRIWRYLPFTTGRPPTTGAAIVFDPTCEQAVLLDAAGDTWTFSASEWTRQSWVGPAPRILFAMTYDIERAAVVVFGGLSGAGSTLGETWELRGACGSRSWAQIPTANAPTPRTGARLAYDPVRKVSVLFGGVSSGTTLADTWEWNGSTWSKRMPATSPSARSEHAIAYDPRRRTIVLFGGKLGDVRLDDTWQWDGTVWTPIAPVIVPEARSGMAMALDVTGGLLVVGGELAELGAVLHEMRLRAESSAAPHERCLADAHDDDGDGLTSCDDPDCGARCAPTCDLGTTCAGPRCGDQMCGFVEDYLLCPADCPPP